MSRPRTSATTPLGGLLLPAPSQDASAVRFVECENACLMRVAWRIKEMDERTLHATFATASPWAGAALAKVRAHCTAPNHRATPTAAMSQRFWIASRNPHLLVPPQAVAPGARGEPFSAFVQQPVPE